MSTAIKICGIRDVEIAKETVALGADYVGLVMYPGSVRYLKLDKAVEIAAAVKSAGAIPVGVFVDQTAEEIHAMSEKIGLDTVQLHGDTARFEHYKLPKHYCRFFVVHMDQHGHIQHDSEGDLTQLNPDRDFILYDGMNAGSGHAVPLENFKPHYGYRFFLAGGLTPETVRDAIKKVHPFGVDVSSGVEAAPGKKEMSLIKSFIESVRR